jgi:hypothetical protein
LALTDWPLVAQDGRISTREGALSVAVFTDHRTRELIEIDTSVWKLDGVIKSIGRSIIKLSNDVGDEWLPHVTEGEMFIWTAFYE